MEDTKLSWAAVQEHLLAYICFDPEIELSKQRRKLISPPPDVSPLAASAPKPEVTEVAQTVLAHIKLLDEPYKTIATAAATSVLEHTCFLGRAGLEEQLATDMRKGPVIDPVLKRIEKLAGECYFPAQVQLCLSEFSIHVKDRLLDIALLEQERADNVKDRLANLYKALDDIDGPEMDAERQSSIIFPDNILLAPPSDPQAKSDEFFSSGVDAFDELGICPQRKKLVITLGETGKGKSWWMVECSRRMLEQAYWLLYISFELPEEQIADRLLQARFSLIKLRKKYRNEIELPYGWKEENGVLVPCDFTNNTRVVRFPYLYEPESDQGSAKRYTCEARQRINQLYWTHNEERRMLRRGGIAIHQWPKNEKTIADIQRLYDHTLREFKIDRGQLHIVLDHADHMKVDIKNKRLELGELYGDLSALAKKNNCVLLTASQTSKVSWGEEKQKGSASETVAKEQVADLVFALLAPDNLTKRHLAKMIVTKTNYTPEAKAMLVQCYEAGQFALASRLLGSEVIEAIAGEDSDGSDPECSPAQGSRMTALAQAIVTDLRANPACTVEDIRGRHLNRQGRPVSYEYVRTILADRNLFTEQEASQHARR